MFMPRTGLRSFAALALSALLLIACGPHKEKHVNPLGVCPAAGTAQALAIRGPEVLFDGPGAVGGSGDFLIRNRNAAFVISGADRGDITYYHYGGILVDAVETENCRPIMPERFEELALLMGTLNLGNVSASTLRAFRAETVKVINDGSDGRAAHVRATGVDDYFWLVEYSLIKDAYVGGNPKSPSGPFGIQIVVDYRLEPDAKALQISISVKKTTEGNASLLVGAAMIFGDEHDIHTWSQSPLDIAGFSIRTEIPWLLAASAEGSHAFAIPGANLSNLSISGVQAAIDLNQSVYPMSLHEKGVEATMEMLFSVGGSDGQSAVRALQPYLPQPLSNTEYSLLPFAGSVVDETGEPVSASTVLLQWLNAGDEWETVSHFVTAADGTFGPDVPDFAEPVREYKWIASSPGRHPVTAAWRPGEAFPRLQFGPAGAVEWDVRDGKERPIPARISFFQNERQVDAWFVAGKGKGALAPGSYEVSVTRGFEYEPYHGWVTVPEGGTASLAATLKQLVETKGYLSVDTHVHSAPSPDSRISLADRVRISAAEGVEVPVATDHEIVIGLHEGLYESGLEQFVMPVTGQEYTATLPEHMTIFPLQPDGSLRGGNPPWYGMGAAEMFETAHGRGADVVILNHPKAGGGCDYLCLIGWDRVAGEPRLKDPTLLGFAADSPLWSWNFQGIELLNGIRPIYLDPNNQANTGLFDDWQSFINHGHRIVAVGSSDIHGTEMMGMSRSYFGVGFDDPSLLHPDQLVDTMAAGNVLVSTGAFAEVSIGDVTMGGLANATNNEVDLKVTIQALPEVSVSHFRVYENCKQVAKINTDAPFGVEKYSGTVRLNLTGDAQIVVAAFGEGKLPRGLPQFDPTNVPRVLTNPIYVDVDGNGIFDAPGHVECDYDLDGPANVPHAKQFGAGVVP